MNIEIRIYDDQLHHDQVCTLWKEVFAYTDDHNEPSLAIEKKLAVNDRLFFVAVNNEQVIGTAIAGYDGHRGWVYAIAVFPDYRKQGIGSALLQFAEQRLIERGCMKINLQIMAGNETVKDFYSSNGYDLEERISMGKIITENVCKQQ